MGKPSVNTKCVANQYATERERIIEISDAPTGLSCLVSIHRTLDDRLGISVYREDKGVRVSGPGQTEMLAALSRLVDLAAKQLDQSATHDGLGNCKAIAAARAAIAAANGDPV